MVGFFLKYFNSQYLIDKRFFKKFTNESIKTIVNESIIEKKPVLLSIIPYDSFLLIKFLTSITFNKSTVNNCNLTEVIINPSTAYWFSSFLRFELSNLYFIHDMSLIYKEIYNLKTTFSCLLSYNSILLNVFYPTLKIQSISNLFFASTWVERELSEFNNIFFVGLRDSRRLLTDYTDNNYNVEGYRTNSYSILLQDLL